MLCTSAQPVRDILGRGISRKQISAHVFEPGTYLYNIALCNKSLTKSLPQSTR